MLLSSVRFGLRWFFVGSALVVSGCSSSSSGDQADAGRGDAKAPETDASVSDASLTFWDASDAAQAPLDDASPYDAGPGSAYDAGAGCPSGAIDTFVACTDTSQVCIYDYDHGCEYCVCGGPGEGFGCAQNCQGPQEDASTTAYDAGAGCPSLPILGGAAPLDASDGEVQCSVAGQECVYDYQHGCETCICQGPGEGYACGQSCAVPLGDGG